MGSGDGGAIAGKRRTRYPESCLAKPCALVTTQQSFFLLTGYDLALDVINVGQMMRKKQKTPCVADRLFCHLTATHFIFVMPVFRFEQDSAKPKSIFSGSADIKHLLLVESSHFQNINSGFLTVMKKFYKSPFVLDVMNRR